MDTKAFTFNSSAKYRAGGHFKEKSAAGSTIQSIMVDDKGSHFLAKFPDVFADYQDLPLTGDLTMANKAWENWQHAPFRWWQCKLNFAV